MSKPMRAADWLALALAQLARAGPAGLTVDALCQAAGKTRGSLYHHFQDHDALLAAIVARWRQAHTEDLIDRLEGTSADPGMALHHLAQRLDPAIEIGIRQLVARHPALRPALREADERRIGFLITLWRRAGLCPDDASVLAHVEYAAYVGLQHLDLDRSTHDLASLYGRFRQLLGDPPAP